MTANRLYSKLNIFGVNLYNEITKTRWLQKRGLKLRNKLKKIVRTIKIRSKEIVKDLYPFIKI